MVHISTKSFGNQLKEGDATMSSDVRELQLQLAEMRDAWAKADGRRREGRQLLRRLVKYVREDNATTPGKTRLARLTDQVDDYLSRTGEPSDILR